MKEFIFYIFKSGICITIFLLAYQLLLRRNTFFKFNRVYLIVGLLSSFVLPMIKNSYDVSVIAPATSTINTVQDPTIAYRETFSDIISSNIWFLLIIIYFLGLIFYLFKNVRFFIKYQELKKGSVIVEGYKKTVRTGQHIETPFSVFNTIYLNIQKISVIEKDIILKHENTHIEQKHWFDLFCCECALMLQWFNPLLRVYMRCLKENHEFLADKAVLEQGVSPLMYKAVLVNQAFEGQMFSFSNSFNYPNSLNRLTMMNKVKSSPLKKVALIALVPIFGIFFKAFAEPNYVVTYLPEVAEINASPQDTLKGRIITLKKTGEKVDVYTSDSDTTLSNVKLYVNGKEISKDEVNSITPNSTESVFIESDGIRTKGQIKNVIITKKNSNDPIAALSASSSGDGKVTVVSAGNQAVFSSSAQKALLVVDGEIKNQTSLDNININDVESVEVLKGKDALEKYGDKGKDGVIVITTKKKIE